MSRPAMARAAAFGLPVLLIALLGGCGVGQDTQTARQLPSVNGANGQVGPIVVRNMELAYPEGEGFYPPGSDAPVLVTVVNTGNNEDELVAVTSPVSQPAEIEGQRGLRPQRMLRAVPPDKGSDQAAALGIGELNITLKGLAEDVRPGRTIRVTLLFRQAGELHLDVPIANPEDQG